MRKATAAAGSSIFFAAAPCVVAGVVPWLLTGWRFEPVWLPLRILGGLLAAAGTVVVIQSFVRFVVEGRGTPAPVAPTRYLVVGGFYRYVRNPMYVAVVGTILGQALLLGQLGLLWYAAVCWAVTALFVHVYEEPTLLRAYGEEYEAYRRAVPAWFPRLRPKADPR
ncbi:methyltransferase family protein [Rhizohabitans arisaemae]|uniref:methyltransferase family protein n=1 Tax=Rhizohabitans arisaemae TaxID=2720610 RepID=UPI0024B1733B|nr:isoprenylcysteine carboxylmethyltransferase family protein [Rhizohabitans arisaemae]